MNEPPTTTPAPITPTAIECAACGGACRDNPPTIHRDGFGEGPEVPLCDDCGLGEFPSCPTLWVWIAQRRAAMVSK